MEEFKKMSAAVSKDMKEKFGDWPEWTEEEVEKTYKIYNSVGHIAEGISKEDFKKINEII